MYEHFSYIISLNSQHNVVKGILNFCWVAEEHQAKREWNDFPHIMKLVDRRVSIGIQVCPTAESTINILLMHTVLPLLYILGYVGKALQGVRLPVWVGVLICPPVEIPYSSLTSVTPGSPQTWWLFDMECPYHLSSKAGHLRGWKRMFSVFLSQKEVQSMISQGRWDVWLP